MSRRVTNERDGGIDLQTVTDKRTVRGDESVHILKARKPCDQNISDA